MTARPARLVPAVALLVAGLTACAGGAGSASDTTRSTTTTTTAADTTTTTTEATTTTGGFGPVVNGDGARLHAPSAGTPPRPADPALGCAGLATAGSTTLICAEAGALTGLVERRDADGALTSWVYRATGDAEAPILVSAAGPGELAKAWLAFDDLDGDGVDELVFGFRTSGTGEFLDVDVVDASGAVVVHRDALPKGRAVVTPGALETWTAVYANEAPECCPTSFQHEVIHHVDGAYRLVASDPVAPAAVPEGDL